MISDILSKIKHELNFFRIHIICFVTIPLVMAGIVYAANTEFHIAFVDCLFLTYSAITATGLATVDLSSLNAFQQACLFVLLVFGSMTSVSVMILIVRQYFFRKAFRHVIEQREKRSFRLSRLRSRINRRLSTDRSSEREQAAEGVEGDDAQHDEMVNRLRKGVSEEELGEDEHPIQESPKKYLPRTISLPVEAGQSGSSASPLPLPRSILVRPDEPGTTATASSTVHSSSQQQNLSRRTYTTPVGINRRGSTSNPLEMPRTISIALSTHSGLYPTQTRTKTKNSGYGGFPSPLEAIGGLVERVFPKTSNKLRRFATGEEVDTAQTVVESEQRNGGKGFGLGLSWGQGLLAGRNSNFRHLNLTSEQKDELGGIEYKASQLLLLIVCCYIVLTPLVVLTIVGPYLSIGNPYAYVFESQHRVVSTPWFAAFNVWSTFTNCGLSLCDTSMIPFQRAYPFVFFYRLAQYTRDERNRADDSHDCLDSHGNTAYPICLRFIIWTLHAVLPKTSKTHQSLNFLLQHPRRCFPYLFPAKETWYLLTVLFVLTMTDFVFFQVLDIGNAAVESMSVGTRILAGLMQAVAVRTEGFAIVSLSALVPAVQVLFVIMMYIAVLPLALTVRSTNVYEEQSLGIYAPEPESEDVSAPTRTTSYVAWHVRRQLAFDLWGLGLAIWLICIIERDQITNQADQPWFSIFPIIFEVVSAYGTVGLSLGSSNDNFSLSGNFRTLSKLIMMLVMLRGRHRGLPFAIDRAVMLPNEIDEAEETEMVEEERRLGISNTIGGLS